jgi:hypothetical protein
MRRDKGTLEQIIDAPFVSPDEPQPVFASPALRWTGRTAGRLAPVYGWFHPDKGCKPAPFDETERSTSRWGDDR